MSDDRNDRGARLVTWDELGNLSGAEWNLFHDQLDAVQRSRPDLVLTSHRLPEGVLYVWGPR